MSQQLGLGFLPLEENFNRMTELVSVAMKKIKTRRFILVAIAMGAALLVLSRVLWLPWVSPTYSAELLARDDGLGLIIWAPSAARRWGVAVVQPFSVATSNFSSIRSVAAFTLLEIVSNEPKEDVAGVAEILLAADSPTGRFIGFFAAQRAGITLSDRAIRALELRSTAERTAVSNNIDVIVAIRVAGMTGINEISDALARNLRTSSTPSMVASASCAAAIGMSENPELIAAMQTAILRSSFPDRPTCARALIKMIGANARPVLEYSLKLESDEVSAREIANMLDELH